MKNMVLHSVEEMFDALNKLVDDLERKTSLYEPDQLRARIEALDQFDFFHLDTMPPGAETLYLRAKAIQSKLEAANFEVFESIRNDIRLGRGAQSLLDWVPASRGSEEEAYG